LGGLLHLYCAGTSLKPRTVLGRTAAPLL